MPERMLRDHSRQLTIFVSATKDVGYGAAAAWRERREWKTKASSLGKYMTTADAALFAISMVVKGVVPVLHRADHRSAEIVTESRLATAAIENNKAWALPIVTDIRRGTQRVEDGDGRVALTWLASD